MRCLHGLLDDDTMRGEYDLTVWIYLAFRSMSYTLIYRQQPIHLMNPYQVNERFHQLSTFVIPITIIFLRFPIASS